MNSKLEQCQQICDELLEMLRKKNEAYGNSFDDTYQKFGLIAVAVRLYDKVNRLAALANGAKNEVTDESVLDTVKDLAGYAILTIRAMEDDTK